MRFPATPGWGPPAAAVAVSVRLGGGFPVLCVFVARRVRVVPVLVCVSCVLWWWCWCGCVFRVCWCVCVCVRVWCVAVGFPGWGLLLV